MSLKDRLAKAAAAVRKGRMSLSKAAKELAADPKVMATEAFTELLFQVQEYLAFVLKAAQDLEAWDVHSVGMQQAFSKLAGKKGGVNADTQSQLLALDSILKNLETYKEQLNKLEPIDTEGVSAKDLDTLASTLNKVTVMATGVINTYREIKPETHRKLAKENHTFIEKIASAFASVMNRIKGYLGFPAGRQREILQDLQDMKARAKQELEPKLRGRG